VQHSASLPPFEGRYKVFIIEDAEFLSNEAANCLLKTLEEPAGRVIFLLLTTDERPLPATVISRCQRLELSPLSAAEVETTLINRWGVEPQKAKLLSRLSHGCPGWAISAASNDSLLQQHTEQVDRLLDTINTDYEERFTYASQLAAQFKQSRGTVQERLGLWLDWWRDLMLAKVGCSDAITNIDRLATLVEMVKGYSLSQIRALIKSIQAAREQLRQNVNPQLVLEVLMLDIPRRKYG